MNSIGVGIIGFGFMGRTHLEAYRRAANRPPDPLTCLAAHLHHPDLPTMLVAAMHRVRRGDLHEGGSLFLVAVSIRT